MRALFLLITVLCSSAYSINPFTYFWTIKLTGDTATVAKWKANNDSVLIWAGRMSDTTNKISREIDSIRAGKVALDSATVTGNLRAASFNDSISAAEFAHINGLTGNVQAAINRRLYGTITAGRLAVKSGDTLKSSIISDDGTTATVNGNAVVSGTKSVFRMYASSTTDSVAQAIEFTNSSNDDGASRIRFRHDENLNALRIETRVTPTDVLKDAITIERATQKVGINDTIPDSTLSVGGSARVTGNMRVGGVLSAATGTFSGVVGADSLRSTKGVSGTIGRFTTSIISAIGTFTGTVTVDSLKSTKGINATTGTFSGVVGADSLRSTKGVSGTIGRFTTSIISAIGTFTGTVTVDSLKSTKGINATTGTFSGKVNGATIGDDIVNYSSSSTLTGFASTTKKSVYYLKTGKLVTVWFSIWGVSDDATATFTLPNSPAMTPTGYVRCQLGTTVEAGYIEATGGTVFVQRYGATWPTTGNKLIDGHFSYFVN